MDRRDFLKISSAGTVILGIGLPSLSLPAFIDAAQDTQSMPAHSGVNDPSALAGVKAVLFDTFGTVVDWRGSLIAQAAALGRRRGMVADWTRLVDGWLDAYRPSLERVRSGQQPWTNLDALQRRNLDRLVAEQKIAGLTEEDLHDLMDGWHRLEPWPDALAGLHRLKKRYVIGPLSNGDTATLVSMAKDAGLPWDVVLGADVWRHYKPDPEAYLAACRFLDLPPAAVMLAAAHNADLRGAAEAGLRTGFLPRPTEFGPGQEKDLKAEAPWTVVARDLSDLAILLSA